MFQWVKDFESQNNDFSYKVHCESYVIVEKLSCKKRFYFIVVFDQANLPQWTSVD